MRRRLWLRAAFAGIGVIVSAIVVARRLTGDGRGQEVADAYGCVRCHSRPDGPALSGYRLGAWLAPNITPDRVSGIGAWSRAEVFRYLRQGRAPGKDQASGPMAPIVEALSRVPDGDVYSLVDWLARQPAYRDTADVVPAFARGRQLGQNPEAVREPSFLQNGRESASGASLYNTSCASCHGAQGAGTPDGYYPPLFHNSTVGRSTPYNLLAVLLFGVDRHVTGMPIVMPGFDGKRGANGGLSDVELARLANFVIETFGNPAAATIESQDIETTRAGLGSSGDPPASRGQLLAVSGGGFGADAACFRCHGLDGHGDATAGFPRLAGLDARYLAKQMEDYRSGARPNGVMGPIAARLHASDDQAIALYYAALPTQSSGVRFATAHDDLLSLGASLFAHGSPERGIDACARCHGSEGQGLNGTYPSIVQAGPYTAAQLRMWRAGARRNDYGDIMGRLARPLSDQEIDALAAYIVQFSP
jgi:cytochrome c553